MRRELKAIYTIWIRELTKFYRERIQFASAMTTPILWLIVFGGGMGINLRTGVISSEYRAFIFPGVVGMTLLFTSMRSGISVIWDREFGFLKEILVAPISRTSIVFGKAMGGATNALIQGTMLLLLSFIVGVHIKPLDFILIIPVMLLISLGFDGFGLFIASIIDSFEGFQTIMSFIIMPTFFLSGALFPLTNAPGWLKTLSLLNPLTYGVDAIRGIILNGGQFPIYYDVLVLLGFSSFVLFITSWLFNVKK
ncbi:MAG: ABC transporter permease [Candidatus Methanoperedens sp.]|nr:ABC transporter permease [Candidatus Methanoperedens sp.]